VRAHSRNAVTEKKTEKKNKPRNPAEEQEALVEFLARWPVFGALDRP
jgi:hypothetical protein